MTLTQPAPQLTVCVVTYSRPDYLARCLSSLRKNLTLRVQIVVVDATAKSDRAAVAARFPGIEYVHAPQLAGWMTRSRNKALLYAEGDVIAFLDDDVVIRRGWDVAVLRAFADSTVQAVGGRTCNDVPGDDTYDRPIGRLLDDGTLTAGFGVRGTRLVEIDHGIGANMSFRRAILAQLGGFRDDYPGTAMREDTDMFLRVRRAGGRVVFAPDAAVDHLPAPHVRGKRFDVRYELYGIRNHMVLLARDQGASSPTLRMWAASRFRQGVSLPTLRRRLKRLAILAIGLMWGSFAVLRCAKWHPLPAERSGPSAQRIRRALSR